MKELMFIGANVVGLSAGTVTSTARLGPKWADTAKVGERVRLMQTENRRVFGEAVITKLEKTTFVEACKRWSDNHQGEDIEKALTAAYGRIASDAVMTIVSIIVLQPE